ncbi:MAG: Swt1 family HEPN domain-containing protein [Candidatus Shapirobacteria bacterium]|nr:Swt1 family HEPN domain-containing protein [Candidatus Shapirobacteria bacterium]MDD3003255.1 Swt1 family HEPN domain-containing protein [Candidatus Shapirobacteria bacterium]MDD4382601.1 Swt1 family HEPN domain-containing protein [Candidatus Shapirobacteria bacterium]
MKSISNLKKMVMDGMLVQCQLDKFISDGILKSETKLINPRIDVEKFSFNPRINSDANKMSSVYIVFHCLENSARELIVDRLFERCGKDWWNQCVPDRVKKRVLDLKNKELKNKYHSQRSTNDIGYTTFGDLSDIVVNNWSDFSDLVPNQAWLTSRFDDLEMSRNVIMHSGLLPDDEIDRIKTYVQDWVEQIGS